MLADPSARREDEDWLADADLVMDASEQDVQDAVRRLRTTGRPITLAGLVDLLGKPQRTSSRLVVAASGNLLTTIGGTTDGLVRQICCTVEQVMESAALHTSPWQTPLPFTVDSRGDVFCGFSNGNSRPERRAYVAPVPPLLFTIASIVAGHRANARVPSSGRFYLHCGWVECAACRSPLAWLVDGPDHPVTRACPERLGGSASTIYHRNTSIRCPRPDCFCNGMKIR